MIVKPLDGRGGEGIFHVRRDDRNLFSILEQTTRFGTRLAMAQQYLPAVRRGDKRILLLEGEPLGALLRVPAEGETRANLHVGGRPEKAALDAGDREILERLRPWLARDGLFFVGIDVIGGLLTEVNVDQPDRDPGDERARRRALRGARDRAGGAEDPSARAGTGQLPAASRPARFRARRRLLATPTVSP